MEFIASPKNYLNLLFLPSSNASLIINGAEESLGLANNSYLANMRVSE